MLIDEVIAYIKDHQQSSGITWYEKASEETIKSFEQHMQLVLPKDIKTFYRYCNGFESGTDAFRMLSLEEILQNEPHKPLAPHQFYLAEYLYYSDQWTLSIQSEEAYTIHRASQDAPLLTHSLADFLSVYFKKGVLEGLYEWEEEIENQNT